MQNTAVTTAVCYIPLTVLGCPASATTENKTAVGFGLAPGAFAAVYHFLSCFSQSIFQLANEDSTIMNQPQTFKTLQGLLVFFSEIQSPAVYSKSQYVH